MHLESLLSENVTKLPPIRKTGHSNVSSQAFNRTKSESLEQADKGAATTDCSDCDYSLLARV